MKPIFLVLLVLTIPPIFSEEADDQNIEPPEGNNYEDDEYYDFGWDGGITLFAEEYPEIVLAPDEKHIAGVLNGSLNEREQFIREKILEEAGFRRTANIRFRKTTGSEKALSVLHGIAHGFSLGIVPMKPFFETEYDELPRGEFYRFEPVFFRGPYKDVSKEIRLCMELEYMLQIEFCNGILIRDWNLNYYTEENIKKFEELARSLPDGQPEIAPLKDRYLNKDLPKIRAALERHVNPSENTLRARENLGDSLLNYH